MYIVLTTEGKHEAVDFAYVKLFTSMHSAQEYRDMTNTGKQKHWIKAEIVSDGEVIELTQPE